MRSRNEFAPYIDQHSQRCALIQRNMQTNRSQSSLAWQRVACNNIHVQLNHPDHQVTFPGNSRVNPTTPVTRMNRVRWNRNFGLSCGNIEALILYTVDNVNRLANETYAQQSLMAGNRVKLRGFTGLDH